MQTIDALISQQAENFGDTPVLQAPDRKPLSYSALQYVVTEVVSTLRGIGLQRKDRIALVLPNGPEMAVAFLSITAAAICAPLNPCYRESEFSDYLTELGVSALITDSNTQSPAIAAATALRIPIISLSACLEAAAGVLQLESDCAPVAAVPSQPDDNALVLSTSGTTSRPKTVPLSHRNLIASANNVRRALELNSHDICLNVMPLFHIHGLVGALLSTLSAGASIICTPGFHGRRFYDWMERYHPTWYSAVPTMHQAVLAHAHEHRRIIERHTLRLIRSSSASLPPSVMAELTALFGAPVIEAYGMTEAAHQITSNPLATNQQKPGSVGLPAGPEIAVMNETGQLLPTGQIGEIVIRGDTVTPGYADSPQANQQAFTQGWFRTGDQGYFDADGYLFLTARIKEIINRGGEKITPREVDDILLEHSDIVQAVSFAIPDPQLGEEIGVAVVLQPNVSLTEMAIRVFAANRLADFKVPRIVKIVDEIPKGPTGKLQRIGLAQTLGIHHITQDTLPAAAFISPRTPLERELAGIWQHVLEIAEVGINDDFFLLGGDSTTATELILRTSEHLKIELPYLQLLECPNIAGTLRYYEKAIENSPPAWHGSSTLVVIQAQGKRPPLFCIGGHDDKLWGLSKMARFLGKNRPVLGLTTPPLNDSHLSYGIEVLARWNIERIRQIQPAGPYNLVGYCFGGTVAFEMARQLAQQGQEVALLTLINCFNPAWTRTGAGSVVSSERVRHRRRRLGFHLENLARLSSRERIQYLQHRIIGWAEICRFEIGQLGYNLAVRLGRRPPRWLQRASYANRRAQRCYAPQPYSGSALFIRTLAPSAGIYDVPKMGWDGVILGEVTMLDLPCVRGEIWSDPYVEQIASVLSRHLGDNKPSLTTPT